MRFLIPTLSIVAAVMFIGPFFKPAYVCERGVLFEDRGLVFGKSHVLEIYSGVALTIPCAPKQTNILHTAKEFDI